MFSEIISKYLLFCGSSCILYHRGPENLKTSRPKHLVKWNKSISRTIFLTKFHFLQFHKWPKINFWTGGKSLKLPRMQFYEKNVWFIWFHEFFCLDFFKFSGLLCATENSKRSYIMAAKWSECNFFFRIRLHGSWKCM